MKAARPFDISLTDREATRKAKRKKLCKIASIPSAAIAVLAVWLALPFFITAIASSYYQSGAYETGKQWLNLLTVNDMFERYKLPYNQALTQTQAKQYDKIDDLYTTAIALAPKDKKCDVYVDYVLSIERRADSLVQENKIPSGIVEYTKAITLLTEQKTCFGSASATEQRIRQKLQSANEALARQQSRYKTETPAEQKKNTSVPSESDQKKLNDIEAQGRRKYNVDRMWDIKSSPYSDGQKW